MPKLIKKVLKKVKKTKEEPVVEVKKPEIDPSIPLNKQRHLR